MSRLILFLFLTWTTLATSQTEGPPAVSAPKNEMAIPEVSKDEKKQEVVDFNSIKEILKNDKLEPVVEKKVKVVKVDQKKRDDILRKKYMIPTEQEFWSFFSEMWLVKRATQLKWDFKRPHYGIEQSFKLFLEKMGFYQIKFKILVVDSPSIFHFGLPSNPDEYILILSLPFIRSLDLSQTEISILLFENFYRLRMGFMKAKVTTPELTKYLGSDFYNKPFDKKLMDQLLISYDDVIFKKGFNFQEQFAVTKEVGTIFKNNLKLWGLYYKLVEKIDDLVKSNILFKNYNSIYPSPELQLGWLAPKKSNLN